MMTSITKLKFEKPPLSVSEQLERLAYRGLNIPNKENALKYLANIGYYRLSGYWKIFEVQSDTNDHTFAPNTPFDFIIQAYEFDRHLRLLFLDALERIEISIKSLMNNYMSLSYGAFWHLNSKNIQENKEFELQKLMMNAKALKDPTHKFIDHYAKKYHDPKHPPSWMIFELLNFGDTSKVYSIIRNKDSKIIAGVFNTSPRILKSWLRSITNTRNICAHHGRLINREFPIFPEVSKELKNAKVRRGKLGEQAFIIFYLLKKIYQDTEWLQKFETLITSIKDIINSDQIGLSSNWFETFQKETEIK